MQLSAPPAGVTGIAIGTFILGCGMAVGGVCPGTIYAQIGSGNYEAFIAMGGGVVGALCVSFLNKHIQHITKSGMLQRRTMDVLLNVAPWITALAIASCMIIVIVLVRVYAYDPMGGDDSTLAYDAQFWSPIFGGAMIGSVQIPLTLGAQKNLGSSTSIHVLASYLTYPIKSNETLNKYRGGWKVWWQVFFVVVATLAATASAAASDVWYTPDDTIVKPYEAFIGGFFILFGSRIAGGCTSGHGITGAGHQSIASFVGIASMFAGGIVTSLIFYR